MKYECYDEYEWFSGLQILIFATVGLQIRPNGGIQAFAVCGATKGQGR